MQLPQTPRNRQLNFLATALMGYELNSSYELAVPGDEVASIPASLSDDDLLAAPPAKLATLQAGSFNTLLLHTSTLVFATWQGLRPDEPFTIRSHATPGVVRLLSWQRDETTLQLFSECVENRALAMVAAVGGITDMVVGVTPNSDGQWLGLNITPTLTSLSPEPPAAEGGLTALMDELMAAMQGLLEDEAIAAEGGNLSGISAKRPVGLAVHQQDEPTIWFSLS